MTRTRDRLAAAALAGGVALAGTSARAAAQPAASPAGGRLLGGVHGEGAAAREYRLYVPAGRDASRPAPLVVFLHGCTQDGDDAARGTRLNEAADHHGFLVLYPTQPASANPMKCWNWFDPAHQRRGVGEPAAIEAMTRAVVREHRVDPARVHVAGISAGGAMAMVVGAAYPEVYASVASHSGVAVGAAAAAAEAVQVMRAGAGDGARLGTRLRETLGGAAPRPLLVMHGAADAVVSAANARAAAEAWAAVAGARAEAPARLAARDTGARAAERTRFLTGGGRPAVELVIVEGLGHAWSGGSVAGTYADPAGPGAAELMAEFFARHALGAP